MMEQKHPFKRWEVSMMEISDGDESKFKVTRQVPALYVAETKMFETKEEAKKQFDLWLRE